MLQQLYFSKSYRDSIRGYKRIDKYFDRVLELPELNEDQRIELVELQKTFRSRASHKSEKYASALEKSRQYQTIAQMSKEVAGEFDQEIATAMESRKEFVESTETQINSLIGSEILASMEEGDKQNAVEMQLSGGKTTVATVESGSNVSIEITSTDDDEFRGKVHIPNPIAPLFAARATAVLHLDESNLAIIEAVYDGYRESYDAEVETTKIEIEAMGEDTSLTFASKLKKTRELEGAVAQAVALLDADFFEDLAAVNSLDRDDPNIRMLEHHRQRQRSNSQDDPFGVMSNQKDAVIDLVDLYVLSEDATETLSQISSEAANTLTNSMQSYHENIRDLHLELQEANYNLSHMQDAMYLLSESEQNERVAESMRKRWVEVINAIRDTTRAMLLANQTLMTELLDKIPEDDYWSVRTRYVRKAYPAVFKDSNDATTMLVAALAIQSLDAGQRSGLEQLSTSYKYDYWKICEAMISNRQSNASANSGEMLFNQEDIQREIDLETLRFQRSELNSRIRMRLRMILQEDQIKDVPSLHSNVSAPRESKKK